MFSTRKRRIILGVTGSTAAIKAQSIVGGLQAVGFDVRVAMTYSAQKVITENPLRARVDLAPYIDMWALRGSEGGETHIEWAEWADAMLIAPATASVIASLWTGHFDSPVTLVAGNIPQDRLFVAPAMSQMMWEHPANARNVKELSDWGVNFLGPIQGKVANGGIGQRMMEPRQISEQVEKLATLRELI